MNVTALLTNSIYGKTPEERLGVLENQGFLVRKLETYDARFIQGGYEWGIATGGRGILIKKPQLVLTLKPVNQPVKFGKINVSANIPQLAAQLKSNGKGGKPTAIIPTAEEIKKLSDRFGFNKPAWMPTWQWQRVQELQALGGDWRFPDTPEDYAKWIDSMLAISPRTWDGFDATEKVQTYMRYAQAMPAPVREHWQNYWKAWLMPDRNSSELLNSWTSAKEIAEYYNRTGDWRGNTDFYRTYSRMMGTMNFNHTAVTGALLGGAIINSEGAIADGRNGLEQFPLRTWSWYDGSTQESIDHYYFALSLTSQKIFADFAPTQLDRMMGESILAKSVEELTSSYHPGLKRLISSSNRTGLAYLFVIQDGLQHILHTLSPQGALHDVSNSHPLPVNGEGAGGRGFTTNKNIVGGMPVIGNDVKPGQIALQTLNKPWASDWVANMVDNKPLPYEITMDYKAWGNFNNTPLWRKSYLGHHYGIASIDTGDSGNMTVPAMVQWRREDKPALTMDQVGTLLIRPGVNKTELLDTLHGNNANGSVGTQGGMATLQHKNKMIVLTSPFDLSGQKDVKSLQTTIGLFNFQGNPTWEIYVNNQRVTSMPFKAKMRDKITIKDGISYIGIIPLPASNLGRNDEIVISNDGAVTKMQGGGEAKPTLLIQSYNLQQNTPLNPDKTNWKSIDRAYGGFVIEAGDVTEYKSFAQFQDHIKNAQLDTQWQENVKTLDVTYKSGNDTMEVGYLPEYAGKFDSNIPTDQLFAYRRVNGQFPYLPKGIDRDSTLTQQGTTGRLEKNGAVLVSERDRMAYLQTEPVSGTYAGFNPFPEPNYWSLTVPGGVSIKADGRLGITRAIVRPKENKVWIDYATKTEQKSADMATAMLVFGMKSAPTVEYNGKVVKTKLSTINIDGKTAYVIPLTEKIPPVGKELEQRYRQGQAALTKDNKK